MQQKTYQILSISLFVSLLVWGVYVTLVYFGMVVHGQVLMSAEEIKRVASLYEPTQYVLRGLAALFPSIGHTIDRSWPLYPYITLSGIVYVAYLCWYALKTGGLALRFTWRPWHIYTMFFCSIYFIFLFLTGAKIQDGQNATMRRVVEPTATVYANVGKEGLEELKINFESLKESGCLKKTGTYQNTVGLYKMKTSCMNVFFVKRVVSQLLFITFIILIFLITGRSVLQLSKFTPGSLALETVCSFALGTCIWIVLLWLLAVMGILTAKVTWTLLVLTVLVGYMQARYWLLTFLTYTWISERKWYSFSMICGWVLISLLAFNFLTVVRPFPIGWDDLGSYLNRPRLLVSYGEIIPKMATFQWEYITSFGFLLYGFDSIFGATASMLINWLAGVFAVFSIFTFARRFLHKTAGNLSGLLYYSLPIVGHFSFADMKTDNAVFAYQAMAILCLFCYLFPRSDNDESEQEDVSEDDAAILQSSKSTGSLHWIILSGIFSSFAFGTKATAIMTFFTLGSMLIGASLYWSAFIGGIFLSIVLLVSQGGLSLANVSQKVGVHIHKDLVVGTCLLLGLALVGFAIYKKPEKIHKTGIAVAAFVMAFFISLLPWLAYNNIQHGNIIPRAEFKLPDTFTPMFDWGGSYNDPSVKKPEHRTVRSIPEELAINVNHPACKSTSRKEELDRYWGNHVGWSHYLTLPWRNVMNLDSAGYYVTSTPVFLLFPLLLLLPLFWYKKEGRWIRWLFAGTLFLIVQWVFMANGIVWYGIAMFLGIIIGLEALYIYAPDKPNKIVVGLLLVLGFVNCTSMRMWQYEQQKNLLEYPMGKSSSGVMRERTIPYYNDIRDILVDRHDSMPDTPYVYRVGTFIPYFIPKNLEVIGIDDHQLDRFNCISQEAVDIESAYQVEKKKIATQKEAAKSLSKDEQIATLKELQALEGQLVTARDKSLLKAYTLTLARLKALGFNSVIFDTNTATIERDKNGTLHKKVDSFVNFLNTSSLGFNVVINDIGAGVVFVLFP